MKFNKTMVDVINEIRRIQTSSEDTPVKLTAPDIGDILVKIYHESNDVHTKALITIFMREAGESWVDHLEHDEHYSKSTSVRNNVDSLIAKVPSMISLLKLKANKAASSQN